MRFGLVGTGYWASTVHGPGLVAHRHADLVAVWGRRPEQAAQLASRLGVRATDSVEELISSVEAVAFAVPPGVQAPIAAAAADAGRHLLLEKPLAEDLASAQEVLRAVKATGVSTVVFFTARFSPGLRSWFEQLAGGDWDAGTFVEMGSIFTPGSPYLESQWRRDRGALWDIGPHALATLTVAMGPVDSAQLTRGRKDIVAITTKHLGGGVASALLALDAPTAARFRSARFYGSSGVLERPEDPTSVADAYANAVDALEASVRGQPHGCDAAFGAEVVRVIESLDRPD